MRASKFKEFFEEPRDFDGCWVVSREDGETREEAVAIFTEFFAAYYSEPDRPSVNPNRIWESTVRFQLVGRDDLEDWDDRQVNGRCALWCLGETGRGAKSVWVLE